MSVTGQLRGSANYIWSPNDVIGRGATGEVYKCRSKRNGEMFAVKTFNNYSFMRPRDVQKRELEVIQKLDHINIVKTMCVEEEINTGQQVIIMEYCDGGSVYSVLDEPEFMFGVPEDEFLVLLKHIADGMQYLHVKQVVHRDIKPGNILRLQIDDKSYIYKLSDFGAARELVHEEENFMSMHGTEEYLDPSVYERAVMGQGHGRKFDASVDLWSLGVTLYHIAVGQLPFRPFGGRKNKDTMFEIHSKKESGVISGVQETEGGRITWSRELPPTCLLSQGLRDLITPIIAGLLEVNSTHLKLTYEDFFRQVDEITNKHIIHVFHTASCASLRIYANPTDTLAQLQELIAVQTDIPASNQHLVYQYRELMDIVKGTQPVSTYTFKTTVAKPIMLYFGQAITEFRKATFFEIPRFPRFGTVFSLDNDAPLAKQCSALMFLIGRHVDVYNQSQAILHEAVAMYSWVITSTCKKMKGQFDAISNPVQEVRVQSRHFKESYQRERRLVGLMFKGRYKAPNAVVDFFQKTDAQMIKMENIVMEVCAKHAEISKTCEEFYQKLVIQDELGSKWDIAQGCTRKCHEELSKLIESVDQTRVDFKRDKQLKRLTYNEEQIHKVLKNTMNTNCSRGVTMAQTRCYPTLKTMYQYFSSWFRKAHPVRVRLQKVSEVVSGQLDKQIVLAVNMKERQDLHSENMLRLIEQLETGKLNISPSQLTVNEAPEEPPSTPVVQETQEGLSSLCIGPLQLLEEVNSVRESLQSLLQMGDENEETLLSYQSAMGLQSMTSNGCLREEGGLQEFGANGIT